MSGGGGGTFAVVLSMTTRIHLDGIVGGATIIFNDSAVGNDAFWDAVGAFQALLPPLLDAGSSFSYGLLPTELIAFATMPGANLDQVDILMKPFLNNLTSRGITPQYTPLVSNNYLDHFNNYFGDAAHADYTPFTDSRIFPRSMVVDPAQNPIVTEVLRNATLAEAFSPYYCDSFNVSYQAHSQNAVLPAWRDGIFLCSPGGAWNWSATPEEMAARQDYAVNVLQPMFDAATPGGGVYLNEANYMQKNWQQEFYGVNYDRLLAVKKVYDPDSMLYAHTAVGSEAWTEERDGRLCRT